MYTNDIEQLIWNYRGSCWYFFTPTQDYVFLKFFDETLKTQQFHDVISSASIHKIK